MWPEAVQRDVHRLAPEEGRPAVGRDHRDHHEEHAHLRLPLHQQEQYHLWKTLLGLQGNRKLKNIMCPSL